MKNSQKKNALVLKLLASMSVTFLYKENTFYNID